MICQECRSGIGRRYVIRNEQGIRIVVRCDACANPQPPKPRWFRYLTAKDMTAA